MEGRQTLGLDNNKKKTVSEYNMQNGPKVKKKKYIGRGAMGHCSCNHGMGQNEEEK